MSVQQASDYFRFCPGEEHVKLSNAVCRGRRRSNYPKCKGCQFNDDERARIEPVRVVEGPAQPVESVLSEPVVVSAEGRPAGIEGLFRESDVRGLSPVPLSPAAAWRIGYAAAQFLRSRLKGYDRADPMARSLVTGSDLRSSSARVHAAMVNGVRAAGVTVYDIGAIDTPQLYFAVRHLGTGGGIVTTGGRDPVAYSGFKICGAACRDVATVTGLTDIRDIARRLPQHETGSFAPRFEADIAAAYRDYVRRLTCLGAGLERPLTVVVDASDGAAGRWVPRVLGDVEGLTLVMLNDGAREPFAHEPDPTDAGNLAELRRAVKAQRADVGVCFDGDADACVFVDERGVMVRPDAALGLLARHVLERRGGGSVVYDHRAGLALGEEIERCGGIARRERCGSQHIKKSMAETDAVMGGTLSGQIFLRDNANCESGLAALGMMLALCGSSPRKLSDRVRPLIKYRASGERRIAVADPEAALARLAERYRDGEHERIEGLTVRLGQWWFHAARHPRDAGALSLRAEATSVELLREKAEEVEAAAADGAAARGNE